MRVVFDVSWIVGLFEPQIHYRWMISIYDRKQTQLLGYTHFASELVTLVKMARK